MEKSHWAYKYAEQIIKAKEKDTYIVESGITPSGVIHAGNFREVLTQDFVYRALLDIGVNAVYQYVWDDYDRFRKVPKGVPKEWEEYIGLPVTKTPDPWGCHDSYASHFKDAFMKEAEQCGVEAKYISMREEYEKGVFSDEIKKALENRDFIKSVLDKYRKEPLPDDWMPARVYCEKCGKDTTRFEWLGDYKIKYVCDCGNEGEFDFRRKGIIKLPWRVDWPMRLAYYDVDFESSGKEHQAAGGSMTTTIPIYKKVFGGRGFIGPMYEFVYFKGQKEKMSSSAGNVVTVSQLLEVYEAEVIRYMYNTRINRSFEISFDMDLLNTYNYFDKAERMYYGKEKEIDENEVDRYRLSVIEKRDEMPEQPPFSSCVNAIQIALGDIEKAIEVLRKLYPEIEGKGRTRRRLALAWNWVKKYAPEQVKFTVKESLPELEIDDKTKQSLKKIAEKVKEGIDGESLQAVIYEEGKKTDVKQLFSTIYLLFIGKSRGPRLGPFLASMDRDFVVNRLLLKG
ncbi:lysine--tRNA ligase [Candidatus Micrarchaeota archaeon]|nr:MAG: lysine--tRNA ligase [Candidatus Micrarchaeota archaeon]